MAAFASDHEVSQRNKLAGSTRRSERRASKPDTKAMVMVTIIVPANSQAVAAPRRR